MVTQKTYAQKRRQVKRIVTGEGRHQLEEQNQLKEHNQLKQHGMSDESRQPYETSQRGSDIQPDNSSQNTDSGAQPSTIHRIITTRRGGTSQGIFNSFNLSDSIGDSDDAVSANRARLAAASGLDIDAMVWMEQIHSPHVTVVRERSSQPIEATDALVTDQPDLALIVLTADCVPVLLGDEESGIIAAVHAGRMGARAGIVRKTIEVMQSLGAETKNIHALLGPAASGYHYEVPDFMAADVEKHLPGSRTRTSRGTPGLDLRAGIARQLLELGLAGINSDPRCTIGDPDFFSYRREGSTGRQASMIWRTL